MKSISTICFALFLASQAFCQTGSKCITDLSSGVLPMKQHELMLNQAQYPATLPHTAAKTTNLQVFDTAQWAISLDSHWGNGVSDSNKLSIFDQFWLPLDSNYDCFVQLPMYNWDSIVSGMRAEIAAGVSKGRFAAIINRLSAYINDGHSHFYDATVNYTTTIFPGMPVFRGKSARFGACITTLDDSTAMVYDAPQNHPFGLEPGDIILGYNNIPWKNLVKILLDHQLPNANYLGSTDAATWHRYVQAAGDNWYLFDTINIRKCNGSLVNLPVDLMNGASYSTFCTEQMPMPGVPRLSYSQFAGGLSYTSGVVAGTRIGYVYMYDCLDMSGDSLYNRIRVLVEDSLVNGLIIDIRTNYGGSILSFEKAFQYLNNGDVSWVGYGERPDPNDRYAMINSPSFWYDVTDDDPMSWDKPIAVLTGPNAVSSGDLMPVLFKHDPFVKLFGKSTAGAYGSYMNIPINHPDYYASRQEVNFYEESDPSTYISHTNSHVDFPTWFSQDSVCKGVDNVVKDAIQWIQATNGIPVCLSDKTEIKLFPNPAKEYFNLAVRTPVSEKISITVYSMEGLVLASFSEDLKAGTNNLRYDLARCHLPGGNYFISIDGKHLGKVVRKLAVL